MRYIERIRGRYDRGLTLPSFVACLGRTTAQHLVLIAVKDIARIIDVPVRGTYMYIHVRGCLRQPVNVNPVEAIISHLSYIPQQKKSLRALWGACQVNTRRDDLYLGTDTDSKVDGATSLCAPNATSVSLCNLRAAFYYATSLTGDDVEIYLNVGGNLTQGESIPISG